jgi:hypothetical protein
MIITQKTKARVRQQALRAMCHDANGKLHPNAKLIMAYLRSQCNGDGRSGVPVNPITGQIDPLAMARAVGRREIFDLLARMLVLTLEDRHNLEDM